MYHGVICLYNRANYERFAFATSMRLPGSGARFASSSPLPSLSLSLSHARFTCALVIRSSSRCDGIVYVDAYNAYNDNARPRTSSAMSLWNVDNDDATVIRRTVDCCLQPGPIRSGPDRSGDHRANRRCIPQVNAIASMSADTNSDSSGSIDIITVEKWIRIMIPM